MEKEEGSRSLQALGDEGMSVAEGPHNRRWTLEFQAMINPRVMATMYYTS